MHGDNLENKTVSSGIEDKENQAETIQHTTSTEDIETEEVVAESPKCNISLPCDSTSNEGSSSEAESEPIIDEDNILEDNPVSNEDDEGTEDDEDTEDTNDNKGTSPILRFIYETLEMVAVAVAIVLLLITFVIRYSPVHGDSMTHTIQDGDSLIVQIAFYKPQKNDIVILQAPNYDLNKPLIKRVIATGGDKLVINFNTWEVFVNGEKLDENYVRYNPFEPDPNRDSIVGEMSNQSISKIPETDYDPATNIFSGTVPEGHIFVMGDNRNNSHDSRSDNVGFVDERCVIGRAVYRLYPFSKMGTLE